MTKPTLETLTNEMISASEMIEAAAHCWQSDNPAAKPASFLCAAAKMIADSFATSSDDDWEALLAKMRDERAEWKAR